MRARITASFVAILALALFIAGGVSLFLVRHAATERAEQSVLRQARAVAASATGSKVRFDSSLLRLIANVGGLSHTGELVVHANGTLASEPPPGVDRSEIDGTKLAHGQAISSSTGRIAFAAAPVLTTGGNKPETIAIVFEADESYTPFWYFLVAAGISLAVTAAAAAVISKVVQARVVAVSSAARHVAGGDFSVRVAASRRDYPELRAMSHAINAMAAELDRGRQAEREFLMSVSHDLRTPLTSIRGYSEAIAEGATDEPERAAKVVVFEADRLARLIEDLLDLARLRARQFSLKRERLDLAKRASASLVALRYAFEENGVELVDELATTSPDIEADPDRIGQAVANLLENALKFASSRVVVSVSSEPDKVRLTVFDDGPGIHEEDLPHIFERLYSSSRHPARSVGSGLGLSIVAELTRAMGGLVAIESPPGAGTAISIVFPRAGREGALSEPRRPGATSRPDDRGDRDDRDDPAP